MKIKKIRRLEDVNIDIDKNGLIDYNIYIDT
jgi:hypothetical protein